MCDPLAGAVAMPGGSLLLSHPAKPVSNCSMQYTSLPWSAMARTDLPANPSRRSAAGLVATPPWSGGMDARHFGDAHFGHLAAPRPARERLFWDHWETAAFGQILIGCSQKQPESTWKQSEAIRSSQEPRGAARSS